MARFAAPMSFVLLGSVLLLNGCSPSGNLDAAGQAVMQSSVPIVVQASESRPAEQGSDEAPKECWSIADYFPITPGLRWEYEITYTLAFTSPAKASAIAEVPETVDVEGRIYSKLVADIKGTPIDSVRVNFYRYDEDGCHKIDGPETNKAERRVFPATVEVGTRWSGTSPDGEYESVVVGNEPVSCPAGEFPDCLHISTRTQSIYGSNVEEQWFARGVGLVKQTNQGAIVSSELLLRSHTPATP